jgi:hypothetical protein
MYDMCASAAEAVIECWLVIARRRGVSKDIRGLIAEWVWEQRFEWSRFKKGERRKEQPQAVIEQRQGRCVLQ